MVNEQIKLRGIKNPRVLSAMTQVPRHLFVPPESQPLAYEDRPLTIGHGQTISQPYVVAAMTELIDPKEGEQVLEVGTGSGYQAAVLSHLVKHVYSVEIVKELAEEAKDRLHQLGYSNITVKHGDGFHGWAEHAPFDAIVVTAAPETVPAPLLEQLKPGGRLVIPVGSQEKWQNLKLIMKARDGTLFEKDIMPVRFVPFTGSHD